MDYSPYCNMPWQSNAAPASTQLAQARDGMVHPLMSSQQPNPQTTQSKPPIASQLEKDGPTQAYQSL